MTSSAIVQKLWNYCNILCDDGLPYGDYPSAWSILGVAEGIRTGSERLTFLLLPKAADEKPRSAWKTFPKGAKYLLARGGSWKTMKN
jgi:type I restriction enzyme M protein